MFNHDNIDCSSKHGFYEDMLLRIKGIIEGEHDYIANLANVSAVLYNNMPDVNWAGFYLYKEDQLVLGPFGGNPACIRIPLGKGVCGVAAKEKITQLVKNVHEFPGHIACDGATKSEIVIPLLLNDRILGVLDIDSPIYERFDDVDKEYLITIVNLLINSCKWE